jgi:hypothetical protein
VPPARHDATSVHHFRDVRVGVGCSRPTRSARRGDTCTL